MTAMPSTGAASTSVMRSPPALETMFATVSPAGGEVVLVDGAQESSLPLVVHHRRVVNGALTVKSRRLGGGAVSRAATVGGDVYPPSYRSGCCHSGIPGTELDVTRGAVVVGVGHEAYAGARVEQGGAGVGDACEGRPATAGVVLPGLPFVLSTPITAIPSAEPVSMSVMRSPPALRMMAATVSPAGGEVVLVDIGQRHGARVVEHRCVVDSCNGYVGGFAEAVLKAVVPPLLVTLTLVPNTSLV